eukprot:3613388-Amphidinium_carterae.1
MLLAAVTGVSKSVPYVVEPGEGARIEPIHISDGEDVDAGRACVLEDGHPKKNKRRRWDLDNLPQHLVVEQNDFAVRYRCSRCSCTIAAHSRSDIFAKHWCCTGEAVHKTTNRHFLRKDALEKNWRITGFSLPVLCSQSLVAYFTARFVRSGIVNATAKSSSPRIFTVFPSMTASYIAARSASHRLLTRQLTACRAADF